MCNVETLHFGISLFLKPFLNLFNPPSTLDNFSKHHYQSKCVLRFFLTYKYLGGMETCIDFVMGTPSTLYRKDIC